MTEHGRGGGADEDIRRSEAAIEEIIAAAAASRPGGRELPRHWHTALALMRSAPGQRAEIDRLNGVVAEFHRDMAGTLATLERARAAKARLRATLEGLARWAGPRSDWATAGRAGDEPEGDPLHAARGALAADGT